MTRMSVVLLVLATVGLGGCKSDECQRLRGDYAKIAQPQASSLARVEDDAPVQIGVQVHEDLLTGVIQDALLKRKSIYRANETIAGGNRLRADVSLTRVTVRFGRNCGDCVQIDGRLAMKSSITAGGINVFRGTGGADLIAQVPMRLALEDGESKLVVDLKRIDIRKLAVRGAGGSLPWNRILGKATQQLLRAGGTEITVATWKPLALPGTSVKLAARELKVFRKDKTAWIGFAVGVPTSGPGLKPESTLRRTETVAVAFTGDVISRLMREMLISGQIPARLDDDFKPDKNGHHIITLDGVTPDDDGMLTDFTIWRLPPEDDECYVAKVRARTLLSIKGGRVDGKTPVHLKMTDGEVISTDGDDGLLQIGLWLRSVFVSDTLEAQSKLLAADTFEFGPAGTQRVDLQRIEYGPGRIAVAGGIAAAK